MTNKKKFKVHVRHVKTGELEIIEVYSENRTKAKTQMRNDTAYFNTDAYKVEKVE